jgi:hypothetical protein
LVLTLLFVLALALARNRRLAVTPPVVVRERARALP